VDFLEKDLRLRMGGRIAREQQISSSTLKTGIYGLHTTILFLLPCLLALTLSSGIVLSAGLAAHGSTFTPNITLRVSLQTIELNCRPRLSLFVNGTFLGQLSILLQKRLHGSGCIPMRIFTLPWYALKIPEGILKHWHGLSQSTLPFSGGNPQASQWPTLQVNFSIMSFDPEHMRLEHISITRMLASKLSQPKVR
jgi:hypothetical protein